MSEKRRRPRKVSGRPTGGELAILQVLWEHGERTVRQVHEQLNPEGTNSYTTTLKLMQIMHEKGLVIRDDSERAHRYSAVATRQHEQQEFVSDLAQRLFNGSPTRLALQALGQSGPVDKDELQAIKALIQRMEQE